MSQIPRPPKQGNVMTYVAKVAAGYPHILAGEMDADLDTIYGAWNTGVDTVNIRDGAVTSAKLAADAVGPRELADAAVGPNHLAPGAVTTPAIGDLQVTTAKLADLAVSTAKLAALAVTTGKLADGAVTAAKLGPGAVTFPPPAAGSIGAAQIIDGSVGTAELADGAVTPAKLAIGSAGRVLVFSRLFAPMGLTGTEALVVQGPWTAAGGTWLAVAAIHGHVFLPGTAPQVVGVSSNVRFDGTSNAPGDGLALSTELFGSATAASVPTASIVPFSIFHAMGGTSTPGAHFLKLTAWITGTLTGTGMGANGIDTAFIALFETT